LAFSLTNSLRSTESESRKRLEKRPLLDSACIII
jgi:hypothetical protein